jgi:hypothetical protein
MNVLIALHNADVLRPSIVRSCQLHVCVVHNTRAEYVDWGLALYEELRDNLCHSNQQAPQWPLNITPAMPRIKPNPALETFKVVVVVVVGGGGGGGWWWWWWWWWWWL